MPKFIIEREMPGLGKLSAQELHAASQRFCGLLQQMGPRIQWQRRYVTADNLYGVYIAPDRDSVRERARLGRVPANAVHEVTAMIDPSTAD